MGGDKSRFDIQVMRGVAVLAVVLFHAFPGGFGSGFLGVDVFFVVSGFLITGIILRGLEVAGGVTHPSASRPSTFAGPSGCCPPA